VLAAARSVNVDGMPMPALAPTDVLTSKLLALNEGHLDFEGLPAMVRGVRAGAEPECPAPATALTSA
jgi:hypothetical protein